MKFVLIILYLGLTLTNLLMFVNSKKVRGVELLSLLLLIILMGGNTQCADFEDYLFWYESQTYPIAMEPGYVTVANFFSSCGFSFIEFRAIFISIAFTIAYIALRKLINNYHLILFVYLSYMMVLDAVQIRNTMAISLLLLGVTFLAHSKKMLFLACLLIASTFHFSFLVFLPLFFYKQIVHFFTKNEMVVFVLCGVLCIAALTGSLLGPLSNLVSYYWSDPKTDYYMSSNLLNLVYLLFPFLYYFVAKLSRRIVFSGGDNRVCKEYCDIVLGIGVIFLFVMPLLILSRDSLRIIRDANIELVVVATFALATIHKTAKLKTSWGGYFMRKIQSTPLDTIATVDGRWAVCSWLCRVVSKQYSVLKYLVCPECKYEYYSVGECYQGWNVDLIQEERRAVYV